MSKLIKCVTENFSTEEELTEVGVPWVFLKLANQTFPRFRSSSVTTLKSAVKEPSDRRKKISA